MFDDQKADKWNSLKEQLDALMHEAEVLEDAFEQFREDQIRRRFGELIERNHAQSADRILSLKRHPRHRERGHL